MLNPEFRRNLWLEMTQHRVIGMPLILGAMFLLTYLLNDREFGNEVAVLALSLCGLIVILWGASQAAESILSEVRSHTWENQRMSAMGAWDMAWGKLFGGTVYSWYGALICLAVYLISSDEVVVDTVKNMVLLVLCGLFSQTIALLISLQNLKKDRSITRSQATVYALFGLIAVMPFLQFGFEKEVMVEWYGFSMLNMDFTLTSLALFVVWALVGIYQSMRSELQMHNGLWVWTLFVIWLMVYLAGFMNDAEAMRLSVISSRLLVACLVALSLTYLMIFVESKDPVIFSRLRSMFEQGNWRQLNRNLPSWLTTLLIAFVVCAVLALTFPAEKGLESSLFFVAIYLFVLRDVCIILWINFGKQRKRADMTAILYLIVLYGLLPSIARAMDLGSAELLFFPQWGEDVLMGTLLVAGQFVLVLFLAKNRWQGNYGVTRAIHE